MQNPSPVNITTPEDIRAKGWASESRDQDGHLCSTHASFDDESHLVHYVRECIERGQTVTIWPDPIGGEPMLPNPYE
jgi:hypothetical protein